MAPSWLRPGVLAGGVLGAVLLIVSEFTTLYDVHTASSTGATDSVSGGSHHSYALLVLAVLAAVLAITASRHLNRPALLAIGAVGVVALLIALIGDLPDAQRTGVTSRLVLASAKPAIGLYLETLGAVVLVITSGAGWLMLAPSTRRR